jgi:hypothetical protein
MKIGITFLVLAAVLISTVFAGREFRAMSPHPTAQADSSQPPFDPVQNLPFPANAHRHPRQKEPEPIGVTTPRPRAMDPAQAQREAKELAELAQAIPAQVEQLSKNIFPKDLPAQLKRIEKLAKHLRKEVSP